MSKKILFLSVLVVFILLLNTGCIRNAAPTFSDIPNQAVNEGETLKVDLSAFASSPDGDPVVFSLVSGVGKVVGSVYEFTPWYTEAGNYSIKVKATNSKGASSEAEFSVSVQDVTNPSVELKGESLESLEETIIEYIERSNDPEARSVLGLGYFYVGLVEAIGFYKNLIYELMDELHSVSSPLLPNSAQLFKTSEPSTIETPQLEASKLWQLQVLGRYFEPILENNNVLNNLKDNFVTKIMSTSDTTRGIFNTKDIDVSTWQDLIESFVEKLELAFEYIDELDLSQDIEYRLYPNHFDNDGDGIIESTTPLLLTVDYGDGVQTVNALEFITDLLTGDIYVSDIVSISIDPSGGDAWFDIEYFIDGGTPSFGETDYIIIDNGQLALAKLLTDLLLLVHEPLVIYSLEVPEDILDVIEYVETTVDIDLNGDGNIDSADVRELVGPDFLTFRNEKSTSRLSFIRDLLYDIPDSAMVLADDIMSDLGDIHDPSSQLYCPLSDEVYDEIQTNINDLSSTLSILLETDFHTGVYVDGNEILIKLYNLFDHPENFSDLIAFLPALNNYDSTAPSITLPDETFGGIIASIPQILAQFELYEDFESGEIDSSKFTTYGDAEPFVQSSVAHQGSYAIQFGAISDNQSSVIETSLDSANPDFIMFWWKVSSEYCDSLIFESDPSYLEISGERPWHFIIADVSAGYGASWKYQKDFVGSEGLDTGWLDCIMIADVPDVEVSY